MALTPEQEAILIAIANGTMAAGFTTEGQYTSAMSHIKLQNELNKLTSEYANIQDAARVANEAANAALEAKQAEINAKQEEIKAFIEGLT